MRIDLSELEDFVNTLGVKLYEIPQRVIKEVIEVISKEISEEIKANAASNSMLRGKYNYDEIVNSVDIKEKVDKDGNLYAEINFKGTAPRLHKQGGKERLAAIAFLNEYGVPTHPNQPARPFLKAASVVGLDKAMPRVEEILGKWFEEAFADSVF